MKKAEPSSSHLFQTFGEFSHILEAALCRTIIIRLHPGVLSSCCRCTHAHMSRLYIHKVVCLHRRRSVTRSCSAMCVSVVLWKHSGCYPTLYFLQGMFFLLSIHMASVSEQQRRVSNHMNTTWWLSCCGGQGSTWEVYCLWSCHLRWLTAVRSGQRARADPRPSQGRIHVAADQCI